MKISLSALLILMLLTACLFAKPDKLAAITPQELYQIMQTKDVFLVDVHVPEQRHINLIKIGSKNLRSRDFG